MRRIVFWRRRSPSRQALIPHDNLAEILHGCPRVADVLWRDTLMDAAVFVNGCERA
jgi:hypothetical protein